MVTPGARRRARRSEALISAESLADGLGNAATATSGARDAIERCYEVLGQEHIHAHGHLHILLAGHCASRLLTSQHAGHIVT